MPQNLAEGALGAGIETAAAIAAAPGGRGAGAKHGPTPPGVCPNCHSALRGAFCHRCGQDTRSLRRPLWSLFADGFEGLFGLDGRIWHTFIPLMLRPGYVTRRYLAGIRQPYISPVRLFLAASLVLFIAILLASIRGKGVVQVGGKAAQVQKQTPEQIAKARQAISDARKELQNSPYAHTGNAFLDKADKAIAENRKLVLSKDDKTSFKQTMVCAVRKWMVPDDLGTECTAVLAKAAGEQGEGQSPEADASKADVSVNVKVSTSKPPPLPLPMRRRFADNLQKAVSSPQDYQQALNRWAPRLAFLLAPAYGLLLAGVFFWRRDLFLYDHMVTALHFQSFVFLFLAMIIPVAMVFGPNVAGPVFLLWSNTYLYLLLRRVYHSSRLGAAVRIGVLDIGYLVLLAVAFMALLVLGVVFV